MRVRSSLAIVAALLIGGSALAAGPAPVIDVFKNAACGCCARWAEHMRTSGFEMRTHDVPDVSAERRRLGMPPGVASCHTAVVDGYVIEGHVPASDVRRLLVERPKARGLAVPHMPGGSPGMENGDKVPYDVLLVNSKGSPTTFARH